MRFFGKVGFGVPIKVRPGVWDDVITERPYCGTVVSDTHYMSTADSVLTENNLQTTISVVADAYALENYTAIKYVERAGSLWTVRSVQVQRPRLLLTIGEVYNGPKAPAPSTP